MNQRDISEIRRRLNPDKRNPTLIRGCYVRPDGQVISTFVQPVGAMPQEENEKYMALFKRVLSGTAGQNLLQVDFSTEQVMHGEEYAALAELRASALTDEESVAALYQRAIAYIQSLNEQQAQSVEAQQNASNYLILLMHDGYDVPYKDINGENDRERSTDLFNYIMCCVCPVKQAKSALRYFAAESTFHASESDWVVGAPELGFLFPCFEERSANINCAMYYTRSSGDMHDVFIQSVFNTGVIMPADEQKETFQYILQETLAEECSLDVVQAVHETVTELIQQQKADKNAEPLVFTKNDVKTMLQDCGVSEEHTAAFEEKYDESFGAQAALPAVNMVTPKQFRLDTPNVSIRVKPDFSDLVETRVIDGRRYICIKADDGDVEVNGIKLSGW